MVADEAVNVATNSMANATYFKNASEAASRFGGASSASSLIKQISLPNGAYITNSFDALARLKETDLKNYWGHTLDGYSYQFDPLGLRTNITRSLGLTTASVAYTFDAIGQLKTMSGFEPNQTLRLNENLGWAYDAAHNLRSRTNNALIQTFNVDAANELTSVTRSGTFTVSGATPAPAISVTVNGNPAQIYSDFTFACTNISLVNGTNTFTIIATNIYGARATNVLTLNLPQSVTLGFDNNGSLTNDGAKSLSYDAENQLTNVTVAGQWRSDFVYDGLNRRRVARDFGWQGGAWVLTNEVHYICDDYLLVQERDVNNNPLVTYTRGLDLSGSLQRAGGIGGLLARTDANGSTFYHSDGAGNITALMDGNENIVARYLYNPFGKLAGLWGPMASANVMRFSSMPYYDKAGIVGYWGRFYEPTLQRWPNHDPIGERGGINLYEYVGNNPLEWIDPFGRDIKQGDISYGGGTGDQNNPLLTSVNLPPLDPQWSLLPSQNNVNPNAPSLSPGDPNVQPYWGPSDIVSPLQYQSLSDMMGNGTQLTPDQAAAVAAPIAALLPVPLLNDLPATKALTKCPTAVKKFFGHPFPTKPNSGGLQPWNPANGRYLPNSANPGLGYSPFAQLGAGLGQGYVNGVSGVPMPPATTGTQAMGQFAGKMAGKIAGLFQ